jgi:DNA-binding transcriptional ArsR family regulator
VSLGEAFLERPTQKRPVVYINYEMPLDYFAELSKTGPIPSDFYVITRPEPKLKADTVKAVIDAMKERGGTKGLLVIDSFRGAFKLRAEQENQSGEAGLILRNLQELALESGWIIFVLHHHKKVADREGADNLSGTGDFGAAPDVILSWDRPADPSKPGVLEIEGRLMPVSPLMVQLSPQACVYLGPAGEEREEEEKERILECISAEPMTAKEVSNKTAIPYSTVKKRLNSLRGEGKVTYRERKGTGSPQEWLSTQTVGRVFRINERAYPMPNELEPAAPQEGQMQKPEN